MSLASRVREARVSLGLSARELDIAIDREGSGHTSKIERGERLTPSAQTIAAFAKALGVTVEWLLGGPPSVEMVTARRDRARGAKVPGSGVHVQTARTGGAR